MYDKRMKSDQVRTRWAEVIQHVRTGGTVTVEHYTKVVARIMPPEMAPSFAEAIALAGGDDRNGDASPVLRGLGSEIELCLIRRWDMPERRRELVALAPRVAGTRGDGRDEQRALMVLDWLLRVHLPIWLRPVLPEAVGILADLPRPGDDADAYLSAVLSRTGKARWQLDQRIEAGGGLRSVSLELKLAREVMAAASAAAHELQSLLGVDLRQWHDEHDLYRWAHRAAQTLDEFLGLDSATQGVEEAYASALALLAELI